MIFEKAIISQPLTKRARRGRKSTVNENKAAVRSTNQ